MSHPPRRNNGDTIVKRRIRQFAHNGAVTWLNIFARIGSHTHKARSNYLMRLARRQSAYNKKVVKA